MLNILGITFKLPLDHGSTWIMAMPGARTVSLRLACQWLGVTGERRRLEAKLMASSHEEHLKKNEEPWIHGMISPLN
jgi:hypothetical protein